jgi:uncharacterized protein (TIGR02147 family)
MNIYTYLDYRKYLADALAERKVQNYHFSFRFIAQHLNLSSPGFFNWVISGKRKLPESMIPKLSILFKLDDKECAYLSLMVRYTHTKNIAEREKLFDQMTEFAKKHKKHELQPAQFQLFSKWYFLAIRELLRIFDFKDDFQALSAALRPRIKSSEAREAIEILEKIGLIAQNEKGYYRPVETVLTTGNVWESEMITSLQIALIDLGKDAVISVPKNQRDISNLTICVSVKAKKRIAEEIFELRQKILAISENDSEQTSVCQCNIQLFPISQIRQDQI